MAKAKAASDREALGLARQAVAAVLEAAQLAVGNVAQEPSEQAAQPLAELPMQAELLSEVQRQNRGAGIVLDKEVCTSIIAKSSGRELYSSGGSHSHHTTSHHATPRHATPRHATPHHTTPRHTTPHHSTPYQLKTKAMNIPVEALLSSYHENLNDQIASLLKQFATDLRGFGVAC